MKAKLKIKNNAYKKQVEKNFRYSFRKLKVGLASVAVAAVFLGRTTILVSADDSVNLEETNPVIELQEDSDSLITEFADQIELPTLEESLFEEDIQSEELFGEVVVDDISEADEGEEVVQETELALESEVAESDELSNKDSDEESLDSSSESEKEVEISQTTSAIDKVATQGLANQQAQRILQQESSIVIDEPDLIEILYFDELKPFSPVDPLADADEPELISIETSTEEISNQHFDNFYSVHSAIDSVLSAESQGELDSLRRSLASRSAIVDLSADAISAFFDEEVAEETFSQLSARPSSTVRQNTTYSQDIFTIGTEVIETTLAEGRLVGAYQDRQDLGVVIKAGSTVQIRQTNTAYKENLTLRMWGNDGTNETSHTVGSSWVTVTPRADLVMFVDTPVTDSSIKPQVEWKLTSGSADSLPIYYRGDNQTTFFDTWSTSGSSYALVKGNNFQILVPVGDMDALKRANPDLIIANYDDKIFPLFDDITDIPTNTDPNAPVKGRYFIKANESGIGAAYYTNTHTATNSKSVANYFSTGWLVLHELAHGYEVSSSNMPIVEVYNNIYGTFYQRENLANFKTASWVFGVQKENVVNNLYKSITKSGNKYADLAYRDELILLLSLADYKGKGTFSGFNRYRRQVAQNGGDFEDFQSVWVNFLADEYGIDVADYFDFIGVDIDLASMQNIYNKLPAATILTNVVPDEQLATVMDQLGWNEDYLKNKLSLVTTDDLAVTGLKSQVKLVIDNASEIRDKSLQIMNGDKVVKTVSVTEGEMDLGTLPNGVYSYRIANDSSTRFSDRYLYVKEDGTITNHAITGGVLEAIANLYTDTTYTKLKDTVTIETVKSYRQSLDNLEDQTIKAQNIELADKALSLIDEWDLRGLSNSQFAMIRHLNNDFELIVNTWARSPHIYFNNTYASVTVLDPDGGVSYSKEWIGSKNYAQAEDRIVLKPGSIIYITHKEPNEVRFDIYPTKLNTSRTSPEIYVVQDDGSIIPYTVESRDNGVLVQSDNLGLPLLFLIGNGTGKTEINGSTAGLQNYPLTYEEFKKLDSVWTNDQTGPVYATQAGYGIEQGEPVDIDMNTRFELSDFAKSAGYEIVSITPGNLPGGLYYDTESRRILGSVKDELENGSMRMTVEVVVSNGTNSFTWSSQNIGAILWKDTKGPTIKTTDKVVAIGEELVIDFVARDENGRPKASAEETAEFYIVDGSWTLPLAAGTVSFNDYYDRVNTNTTLIAADSTNATMKVDFRYSLTGNVYTAGLPAGLSYDSQTGKITGTPTTAGTYYIEVSATDFDAASHPQRDSIYWKGNVSPSKSTAVFKLTVADMAYVYEPEGITKTVLKGTEVTAEEMIANAIDLPEGTTYDFTRSLNTSNAGTKRMSVKVTYPDASSELVPVTIIVTNPMADAYTPRTEAKTIDRGQSIEASAFITNITSLPEGTVFSFVTEPDTSQLMNRQTQTILVTYPDETSETVTARLTVIEAQNLTYEPQTKTQTIRRGTAIDAKDSISNLSQMPLTATYSFEEELDTTVVGYHTVTVVVTYADGNQDKVSAEVHIWDYENEKYQPIPQVQTVKVGTSLDAKNSIANVAVMPGRTSYEFITPVDTSTAGTKKATVRVTYYLDDTYDDINVEIIVQPFDNETITPQAKDQSVLRGTSLQAQDFIANVSNLPKNTKFSFVDPISTEELGEFPVMVLVTYPDASTAKVNANLTVYEYDNNRYTPVGKDQTVDKDTQPVAKDSIANTADLPTGTQYSFVSQPDTSKAGTVSSVVRVFYPDKTEDLVDVKIIVTEPNSDTYQPTTKDVNTFTNETVQASDFVTNSGSLPKGTSFSFETAPDTSKAGTTTVTVVATYPDQSMDRVTAKLTVNPRQNEIFEPTTQDITVAKGATPVAADAISNQSDLPLETKFTFKSNVNTQSAGTRYAVVVTTYPDGTTDENRVRIVVVEPQADTYQPIGGEITVGYQATVPVADLISNRSELPADASYTLLDTVDTTKEGRYAVTVQVTYVDKSEELVNAIVRVVDDRPDADKYQPTAVNQTVEVNSVVDANMSIGNLDSLPAGTKASFVADLDTSSAGTKNVTLSVLYPDGSSDRLTARVIVTDSRTDAEKYQPVTRDQVVNRGDNVVASRSITNFARLPLGTRVAFTQVVDTSNGGDYPADIMVSYPDGSSEKVSVVITVLDNRTDAEKYEPEAHDTTVSLNDTVDPSSLITNLSSLPNTATISFVAEPDTSTAASFDAVVQVIYEDGTKDNFPVKITVVDNRPDAQIYLAQTQVQEVDYSLGKAEPRDNISNWSSLPTGTKAEYVAEPDLNRLGDQTASLKVSYPDGSINYYEVIIRIVDNRSDAEKYEPTSLDRTVELGNSVLAQDSIANKSSLPAATSYAFASPVDTSREGEQTVTLVVTYPDKSQEKVTAKITVVHTSTQAESYPAQAKAKEVSLGSSLKATDFIANMADLPEDSQVTFAQIPEWDKLGVQSVNLMVSYPDGSRLNLSTQLTVIDTRTDAEREEPIAQVQTIEVNSQAVPEQSLANLADLPKGTSVSYVEPLDSSQEGSRQVQLQVLYPDKSSEVILAEVKVVDSRTQADRYEPVGKDITVEVDTVVTPTDLLGNASSLPSDAVVSFVTQPDTSKAGSVPTNFRVTYADGSVDTFTATITVVAKETQSDRYEPVGKDITVEVDTVVPPTDLLGNASSLPNDAVVSFVTQPDTSKAGSVPTNLRVTYADGSVDQVAVTVTVIAKPTYAELYPVETQDLIREINSQVGVLTFITNYDELPRTTLIRYESAVDANPRLLAALLRSESSTVDEMTLTNLLAGHTDLERVNLVADQEGRYLMTFEVNYPDGSTNQVTAYLTVYAPPSEKEPVIRLVEEEFAYSTSYQANPQVKADERKVLVEGQTGLVQLTYTDNRLTKRETLREIVNQVIEVGTKSEQTRQTLDYQVMVQEDSNLFPAESYTKQVGQAGELIETTTYTLDTKTGQLTAQTTTSRRDPVNEIQIIGTKTQVTRRIAIPYETRYEADDSRQGGSRQVLVAGHDGILTQTIINGVLASEERSQEPVTEVIVVGTKEQSVKESLPYVTLMTYDDTLYPEQGYVKVTGQHGQKETRTSYTLNPTTGELTSTVTVSQVDPIEEIRVIGTREIKVTTQEVVLPYDTRYEADDSIDADQRSVKVAGQAGLVVQTYLDGVFSSETVSSPAVTEVIIVGTKPVVQEEEIAYDSQIRYDDALLLGQSYIEQVGRIGRRVTTTTYSVDAQTGVLSQVVSSQVQEPVTEIIVQGSRELVTTFQDKIETYKTRYEADTSLSAGEQVIKQAGQNGITRFNYVDGALTSQTVVQVLIDEIILVGTQTKVERQELAFKHLVEEDNQLLPEESYIKQLGQKGRQVTTTSYSLDEQTGELTPTVQVSTIASIDEIQVRGTKQVDETVLEVPFATLYQADANLPYGQTKVLIVGQAGQLVRSFENGELVDERLVIAVVDQVIAVGTQSETETTILPYASQVEHDDQLLPEDSYIKQAGRSGLLEILVTYVLDESTGQVTANRQEKRTDPQVEIRVLGTKKQEVVYETIDFVTRYQADETLPYGQTKVLVAGQSGQLARTLINDTLISELEVIPVVDQVVAIGTQSETESTILPYASQVEYDDQLLPEDSYIKQAGQSGLLEVLVTYTLDESTGQVTANRQEKRTEPQAEIRVVGIKNQELVYETVAFATRYQADLSLAYGQTKTLVEGQNGRLRLTFENGQLLTRVEELAPVTQLIAVGSQPTVTETVLAYSTEIRTDDTLPVGQEVESQAGQNGRLIQTRTYQVDEVTGQVTAKDSIERIEPQVRILIQGSGVNQEIAYASRYIADDSLAYGQSEIRQAGQNGLVTLTGEILQIPQEEIIAVGTQPSVIETVLDFAIERVEDSQLPQGEEKVLTIGQPGLERQLTTYQVDELTGQISYQTTVERQEPQAQLIALGTATTGKIKTIKGTVIVRYLDKEGNALRPEVVAIESSMMGYPYDADDFADKRLEEITTNAGKRYVLAPSLTKGEIGLVAEGISYVDYVYLEVAEELPPQVEQPEESGGGAAAAEQDNTPKSETAPKVDVSPMLLSSSSVEGSAKDEKPSLPNTGENSVPANATFIGLLTTTLGLVALRRREEK